MSKQVEYNDVLISSYPQKIQDLKYKYFCKGSIKLKNKTIILTDIIPGEIYKCINEDEADSNFIEFAKRYIDNL